MRTRADLFAASANWVSVGVTLAVLWFGFQIIFLGVFGVWSQLPWVLDNPTLIDGFVYGDTPAGVRWNLAVFALYTALLAVLLRVLHKMGLRSLIGPFHLAIAQFSRVSLYLLPLFAVLIIPSLFQPEPFRQYDVLTWLSFLPATLVLLFVQISAEELVFRGYLQSHLAALFKSPIIWIGLPSLLFGLIHYDPASPTYSAWAYVVWAACLGLVCADLTARSGTLGPALAVHFVNNIGALLILAVDDWLYGAALFIWPTYGQPWEPWIPYEALTLLIVWLTARLALRR